MLNLRVAGTDEKLSWLTDTLGFDYAINYKTAYVSETLKSYAPNGIDAYFDNVGGWLSLAVLENMKDFGKIAVCGSISAYNNYVVDTLQNVSSMQKMINFKELSMNGFRVTSYIDEWFDAIEQLRKWIHEGHIKYRETVTDGF